MPYLCKDGTSIIFCIVACECAMCGIQSGVNLCQTNTSTIGRMSCFTKANKCIKEMNFVVFCKICLDWWTWLHLWKSLKFQMYERTNHIAKLASLQALLKISWWVMWGHSCLQMADQKEHCANVVTRIWKHSQDFSEYFMCWGIICESLDPHPQS